MSTLNPDGPIYTGPEHLEARPHAMNGLGDPDIPPRVVLDVPGLSIVLTADQADDAARALREQAGQARRVHCDALVAASEASAPEVEPPTCTRCARAAHGWSVPRGDRCSPDGWANCIREPAVVLAERTALLHDVDALAKLTHARRTVVVAGLDEAQLYALANYTRAREQETPEGPQRRRLERAARELGNRACMAVLDAERAERIAAGEDPRAHVWSGMRGAKRGKVSGQDYQVGDTVRVPARAICGAQDKGFNGRILAEGVHGSLATAPDGTRVVQIAMMRSGSEVFHVRRFTDGRVVEVPKPRPGRQRGNTIELYRPDAAPVDPFESVTS